MSGKWSILKRRQPISRSERQSATSSSPLSLEFAERARVTRELAERAFRPAEPFMHGSGDALACELYRQSIYWTLLAHQTSQAASAVESSSSQPPGANDLETLWAQTEPELLLHAAGSPAALQGLASELHGKTFVDFAELESARKRSLAESLNKFSVALLEPFDSAVIQLERIWTRRMAVAALLFAAILAVIYGLGKFKEFREQQRDLAPLAQWTASSKYWEGGCQTPLQSCPNSPKFFFHTKLDEGPWLLFDLGKEQELSAIWVRNRIDCCTERAIPLVVEVSNDQKIWKEVARRTEDFTTWRGEFPSVRTRWVRLKVPRRTFLHLSAVRLLP